MRQKMKLPFLLLMLYLINCQTALAATEINMSTSIEQALANDLAVKIANNDLRKAELNIQCAAANFWPGITGDIKYDYGNEKYYTAKFIVSQTFPSPFQGKIPTALEKALWDRINSAAALQKTTMSCKISTVQKYVQVLKTRENLRVTTGAVTISQQEVALVSKQVKYGTANPLDLLRANQTLNQNLGQQSKTGQDLDLAWMALTQQLGNSTAGLSLAPLTPTLSLNVAEDLEVYYRKALNQRPEIINAETNLKTQERNYQLTRKNNQPSLVFAYQREHGPNQLELRCEILKPEFSWSFTGEVGDASSSEPAAESFSLNYVWKFFDSGVGKKEAEKARLDWASSQLSLEKTRDSIRYEVRKTLNDLKYSQTALKLANTGLELAKSEQKVILLKVENGLALPKDLNQANQDLLSAETAYIQAYYELYLNQWAFSQALGEPGNIFEN